MNAILAIIAILILCFGTIMGDQSLINTGLCASVAAIWITIGSIIK